MNSVGMEFAEAIGTAFSGERHKSSVQMFGTQVNNVANYALEHKYIVARAVDGELWFWGAWDDLDTAKRVAKDEESCIVLHNNAVKTA